MRIIKSLKLKIYSDIYNDNIAARVPRQMRFVSLLRYSSHYCALPSYCLPATDRVICIKFRRSCFRLMLPLLNPKTLQALHLSSYM